MITIDRVVLTNVELSSRDAESFRGAVTAELERLVAERGLPSSSGALDTVTAPLPKSGALAANVAAAIYDALGKAG
ncbi:MAG TPA: hypothetical protein VEO54_31690 [Thermoanaerobaculia bacterium]|nr:hypothetical protein [Thermoanaerobaculia bacterium]